MDCILRLLLLVILMFFLESVVFFVTHITANFIDSMCSFGCYLLKGTQLLTLEVSEAATHEEVALHIHISSDDRTLLESTTELSNPETWAVRKPDENVTAEQSLPGPLVPEEAPDTPHGPIMHDT